MPPLVSLVMPCYNAQRYVRDAIDSVLSQNYPDWELLVVDDGSTDQTHHLIAAYAEPRIRYLFQQNRGPAQARNLAASMAQGAYIAFLDSDDISLPHRLSSQTAILEGEPDIGVLFGGYEWIDESGEIIPWQHSWEVFPELNHIETWLFDCPVVPSATMVRADAFRSVGGFAVDLHGGEDWNLWMRMQLAGYRMLWQHDIVCLYRHHAASLSNDALSMARDCPQALQRILEHPAFPSGLLSEGARALALRYVDSMKRLYAQRLWEEGSVALAHALTLDPELLEGSPCRIEYELVGLSLDPLVGNGEVFLREAVERLPSEAHLLADRAELLLSYRRFGFAVPELAIEPEPRNSGVADPLLAEARCGTIIRRASHAVLSRLGWFRQRKKTLVGRR